MSLREIVRIGMQTAAGLAAAHDKGLIHRDIKPGNILLEKTGQRVKLTDFGLAQAAEDVRLTRTGLVAGTPLYMSPEQATGDELDARSDLFSLGVVLYELAAGEPPFNGKTPLVVLRKMTEERPRPIRDLNPEIPEWFAHIVERLLAKKPADRYQSAREVADTLEHFWVLLKSSETLICPKKRAAHFWKSVGVGAIAGLATLMVGVFAAFMVMPRSPGDAAIPTPVHVFKGTGSWLWTMALSEDGQHMAIGADDGTVKYWDVAAEKVQWTIPAHKGPVWALDLSPRGDFLATGSDDGSAILWNVKTQKEERSFPDAGVVRTLAFNPDGTRLVMGHRKGNVDVWDVDTGKQIFEVPAHSGPVLAVAYSPDGSLIASASGDKTIRLWDAKTGSPTLTLNGHESGVYGVSFSPTGPYLVSGSWDRSVRLWDVDSGSQLAKLDGHTQDVWSVAMDPEGERFASTGEDQMVRIWDIKTRKEVGAFRGSTGAILNVRFTPVGGMIVAAGKDGTARMWKLSDLHLR